MKHFWPANETDLHDTETTMCACGCDLKFGGDGETHVMHQPFNIEALLVEAFQISNGLKEPDKIPAGHKRF